MTVLHSKPIGFRVPSLRSADPQTLVRVAITVSSLAVSYALAKGFLRANLVALESKKRTEVPPLLPSLSSSQNRPLSTVEEVDEAASHGEPNASGAESDIKPLERKDSGISSRGARTGLTSTLMKLHSIVAEHVPVRGVASAILASIVARTVGELLIFKCSSGIDECIVSRNKGLELQKLLTTFVLLGVPVAIVQQLSHLLVSSVSSQIRQVLTSLLMERLVLSPHNLCHPEELVDNARLETLMGDISTASSLSVQTGADRLRKLTELVVYSVFLVRSVGPAIPATALLYLLISVNLTSRDKLYKRAFNKRVAERESTLRKALARITRHRDDIAVWGGAAAELATIDTLVSKSESAKDVRDKFDFLHGIFAALCSHVAGTSLCLAMISAKFAGDKSRSIFDYFSAGRVMIQLCSTASSLIEEELLARAQAQDDSSLAPTSPLVRLASVVRRLKASLVDLPKQLPPADALPYRIRKSNLCLSDITAMSPSGQVLFQSLSLELSPGSSLLVHGPKGAGKSALLRVMAGTWPPVMGEISRPKSGVICVASKPYLIVEGSLIDQITYPFDHSTESLDESHLQKAIAVARISHLFEPGVVARSESGSALLSETDQQKLMIARLIYHKPKYALLDECWRYLEIEHFRNILCFLKNEMNCGVVVAIQTGNQLDTIRQQEFGFSFDIELALSGGSKQPPRHEVTVRRQ